MPAPSCSCNQRSELGANGRWSSHDLGRHGNFVRDFCRRKFVLGSLICRRRGNAAAIFFMWWYEYNDYAFCLQKAVSWVTTSRSSTSDGVLTCITNGRCGALVRHKVWIGTSDVYGFVFLQDCCQKSNISQVQRHVSGEY